MRRLAVVTPFLGGAALAALIAAAAFAVQATLATPTVGDRNGAREIAVLDAHRRLAAAEVVPWSRRPLTALYAERKGKGLLRVGRDRIECAGLHARLVSGPAEPQSHVVIEADLGCGQLLAAELRARLLGDAHVVPRRIVYRGHPAYSFRVNDHGPVVSLVVAPRSLRPYGVRFAGRVRAYSLLRLG